MWKRLADRLAFTTTERQVILFLTVTLLVGLGVRLIRASYPETALFDYRKSDSTFAALTEAANRETADSTSVPSTHGGKLNLNRATKAELMDLPGIGEVTAERIILQRDHAGGFHSVQELAKVKGITRKKLDKIKDRLTVE